MRLPSIITLPANRVWRTYLGGKTLDVLERKHSPKDSHFPEDWIVSTTHALNTGGKHPEDEGFSKVEIDGEIHTLKELIVHFPNEILGHEHHQKYGANTQFLLKFLDSAIRLHIQAHPAIQFAKKYFKSNSGKTEAYVILASREEVSEPYIFLGFQRPISKEKLREAVLEQDLQTILSCFEKIPVRSGDVFIVPGGLPHAIGEGIFMIEIMEPSDLAVRLEFERGGYVLPEADRFMGRDVDFAIDMIDFTARSIDQIKKDCFCRRRILTQQGSATESVLIDETRTPCFSVHRLDVTGRFVKNSNTFYAGVVTEGEGIIVAEPERKKVKKGDKFLVPFRTGDLEFIADNHLEIVLVFPPH